MMKTYINRGPAFIYDRKIESGEEVELAEEFAERFNAQFGGILEEAQPPAAGAATPEGGKKGKRAGAGKGKDD